MPAKIRLRSRSQKITSADRLKSRRLAPRGSGLGRCLPAVSIDDAVLIPGNTLPFFYQSDSKRKKKDQFSPSIKLKEGTQVCVLMPKEPTRNASGIEDFFQVGVLSEVRTPLVTPDGRMGCTLFGLQKVFIQKITSKPRGQSFVIFRDFPSQKKSQYQTSKFVDLSQAFLTYAKNFSRSMESLSSDTKANIEQCSDAEKICDLVVPLLTIPRDDKLAYLALVEPQKKIRKVRSWIAHERNLRRVSRELKSEVTQDIDDLQRRYFLQEQIRALKRELGELDDHEVNSTDIEDQIKKLCLPKHAKQAAFEELERMRSVPAGTPEYVVSHNYLTLLKDLPWERKEISPPSLKRAKAILDRDHCGLERTKARIIEYIAVLQHGGKPRSQILVLSGPPGVGKTSMAKSIAQSLRRPFVKIALGGVHDEAEIRGHRRTYIAAMPGKILQGIRSSGSRQCVMLLDELDKSGNKDSQSISSALLELLDPEQNQNFTDHYLGVGFDLSEVIFLATANDLDQIPQALRDRLEPVEIPSYSELEKLAISKQKLIPSVREEFSLSQKQWTVSDDGILKLIRSYTREAGVRQLRREMQTLARKRVLALVRSEKTSKNSFTPMKPQDLVDFLGPQKYLDEAVEAFLSPGVSTGLAFTEVGGEILMVEVSLRSTAEGRGKIQLTGSLGSVMQESVHAAASFLASRTDQPMFVPEDTIIHVHFPDGGTPKDGPSAGIAIMCALQSAHTKKALAADLAMTGEITLRGQVLAVGGIREKIMAAHRYGKKRVMIPRANSSDLRELPVEVLSSTKIVLVDTMDEVLVEAGLLE